MSVNRLGRLPTGWYAVAVAAGFVSLFGTYWDDAWHTDRGRDDAWIPPHLVLYGAVAIAGLVIFGWGLATLRRTRSVRAVLAQPSLLLAGLGGVATLAAAPIDATWHSAFGRDAVLWSPPHLLAVAGSAVLVIGIVSGTRRTRRGAVAVPAVALLLGALLVPVLEYETDVPQFSEVWYLPVLLVGALGAAAVARSLLPGRLVVAPAVLVYAMVRLGAIGLLALLGFSTPDLPVAVLGLAVMDLPWRTATLRYGAAAAAVSVLAWLAAGTGVAAQQGRDVAVLALPIIASFGAVAVLAARRGLLAGAITMLFGAGILVLAVPAPPASAHDPGQGAVVGAVTLTVTSDGAGRVSVAAELGDRCAVRPVAVVARRAGTTIRASLAPTGRCQAAGSLEALGPGLWFVYVELEDAGGTVEAWLPVHADRREVVSQRREVYRPSGGARSSVAEVVAGVGLYGVIALLLFVAAWQMRRLATMNRPVTSG